MCYTDQQIQNSNSNRQTTGKANKPQQNQTKRDCATKNKNQYESTTMYKQYDAIQGTKINKIYVYQEWKYKIVTGVKYIFFHLQSTKIKIYLFSLN